jgi:phage-related minor tail protein
LPEGQDLSPDQREEVTLLVQQKQAQAALNDEEARKQQLLQSIIGPQQAYLQAERDLLDLLNNGDISRVQYNEQLEKLKSTLPEVASATQELADGAMASLWNNATSALDNFVDTGIFKFKDFARSVISDITKIAAKMLLLQAFKAMGLPVPGFATGGSFMVGGEGGTDQNLVAFRASRGERVDVLTPAQQAAQAQGQGGNAMGAAMSVTIINVVDPEEIPAIMASEAGQAATLNTISLRGGEIKQAIA